MRLFVAIDIPAEIKEQLAGIRSEIPGARWVPAEQLHLTLCFLGEVDSDKYIRVKSQLTEIESSGFDLCITGTGCFPERRRPKVIWIGLTNVPQLITLAGQIRTAVTSCGIALEERPFSPHITLARCRFPATKEVAAFLDQYRMEMPVINVREFILYESRLTPHGAIHTPLEKFPLLSRLK